MNSKNIINFAEVKTIICCENFNHEVIGAYLSVKDAAEDLLIDESEIFDAIESKESIAGLGYLSRENAFIIHENKKEYKEYEDLTFSTERGKHKHPKASVPVVQLEYETHALVARYHSMYDAFRFTGARNISKCCKGEAQSSGGYRWMFESEYDAMINDNLDDLM
jgi:hypothetical protein